MKQDEIIEMARQAGIVFDDKALPFYAAFAKLVAAKEREACAKVCEDSYTGKEAWGDWPTPDICAAAIRERGKA